MRREIVVLLGALGVAGCATTEMPLNMEAIRDLGDRSVHIVKEEPPSFGAITAGKGMFAALGAVAAVFRRRQSQLERSVDLVLDQPAQIKGQCRLAERLVRLGHVT